MKAFTQGVIGRARSFIGTQVVARITGIKAARAAERMSREKRQREPGLASIDPKKPVYVFFAPEAGVGAHFATHCMVARTLKELGHQVLMVRCDNHYSHCVVMDMFNFTINKTAEQRSYGCLYCRERELRMTAAYGLASVDLADLVSARTIAKIERQAQSMPPDAGEFKVDGIRFGALCGSDLALNMKTLDQLRVTGDARRTLEAYVAGSLLSYRVTQALIRRLKVARLTFFNEYGMLVGAAMAAIKAGVPITRMSLAIHKNVDRRKIILLHDPLAIITYHNSLDRWEDWRDLALPPEKVEMITDNNLSRIGAGGFTVYSPKHSGAGDDIFNQLKLSPDRHILAAYTSSMDEFNANQNLMKSFGADLFQKEQPFKDQVEWLEALIDYVERSKHLQLIIRIHPREGKNAREHRNSEHLQQLLDRFSRSYEHVRVIWPQDPMSSYDLAEIATVVVSGWSNISLELARLGIPVITAFKRYVPYPIPDVVQWAPAPAEYFQLIERAVDHTPNLDAVRFAYRWSNVYSLAMSIDFDDVIPTHDYEELPPFQLPKAAPLVESIMVRGKSVREINRQELIAAQSDDAARAETEALRRQLRRSIWFLATGEDRSEDYRLFHGLPEPGTRADLIVTPREGFVEIRTGDKTVQRRSMVIRRLAGLAANVPAHGEPVKVN